MRPLTVKPGEHWPSATAASDPRSAPHRGVNPASPPKTSSPAPVYAAVSSTNAGFYISIWSEKAEVWVRLLNRYSSWANCAEAIAAYGWTVYTMPVAPHGRERRKP